MMDTPRPDKVAIMAKQVEIIERAFKDGRLRRFSGVAGKVVKSITAAHDSDHPQVDIQFEDGTALVITVEVVPQIVGEWQEYVGMDLEPVLDKKVFE